MFYLTVTEGSVSQQMINVLSMLQVGIHLIRNVFIKFVSTHRQTKILQLHRIHQKINCFGFIGW